MASDGGRRSGGATEQDGGGPQDESSTPPSASCYTFVRVRQSPGGYQLKVDGDLASHTIRTYRGVDRSYSFNRVFGPEASNGYIYQKIGRMLIHRAVSDLFSDHSVIFVYGAEKSGRGYTVRGDSKHQGLLPFMGHELLGVSRNQAFTKVTCQCLCFKSDNAVVDVFQPQQPVTRAHQAERWMGTALKDTPQRRPSSGEGGGDHVELRGMSVMGLRTAEHIEDALGKFDRHRREREGSGHYLFTFTVTKRVQESGMAMSKISLVLFDAVERLTQRSRRHITAMVGMLRALGTGYPVSRDTLRRASRDSKLTQILHSSNPPALTHTAPVIFLSTITSSVSDTTEKCLKFTEEVQRHMDNIASVVGTQHPLPMSVRRNHSTSVSPPQPRDPDRVPKEASPESEPGGLVVSWPPSPEPARAGPPQCDGVPFEMAIEDHASSTLETASAREQETEAVGEWGRRRACDVLPQGSNELIASLETQLMEAQKDLYASREKEQETAAMCLRLKARVDEESTMRTHLERSCSQRAHEVAQLKEAKRLLQNQVAQLQQAQQDLQSEGKAASHLITSLQQELDEVSADRERLEGAVQSLEAKCHELSSSHRAQTPVSDHGFDITSSARNEVARLRAHLEEAQGHIRQLSTPPSDIGGRSRQQIQVLSRHLQLSQELCQLYVDKAEGYEHRLKCILQGAEEAVDGDRIHLLLTKLDESERRRRHAELELQSVKLDRQATEAVMQEEVHEMQQKLSALEEAMAKPPTKEAAWKERAENEEVRKHMQDDHELAVVAAALEAERQSCAEARQELEAVKAKMQLLSGCDADRDALREQVGALKAQLEATQTEYQRLREDVAHGQRAEDKAHELTSLLAETALERDRLQQALAQVKEQAEQARELGSEVGDLRRRLAEAQEAEANQRRLVGEALARADREATAATKTRRDLEAAETEWRREREEMMRKITALEISAKGSVSGLEKQLEASQMKLAHLASCERRVDELSREKDDLQKRYDALAAERVLLQHDSDESRRKTGELELLVSRLKASLQGKDLVEVEVEQVKTRVNILETQLAAKTNELGLAQHQLVARQTEIDNLREELDHVRDTADALKREREKLFEAETDIRLQSLKDLQEAESMNQTLKLQLQAKEALTERLERKLMKYAQQLQYLGGDQRPSVSPPGRRSLSFRSSQ